MKKLLILRLIFIVIVALSVLLPACKRKPGSQAMTSRNQIEKVSYGSNVSGGQGIRAVSLKVLATQADRCMRSGNCSEDVVFLGEIEKVAGYVIDEKNKDIILYGEAGGGRPPLHLEDFVLALRNAWLKYAELKGNTYFYSDPGCSIDPNPLVIDELQRIPMVSGGRGGQRDDQAFISKWQSVCSKQQMVRVLGLPFDTHFAKVMVDADYYMKRLVNGSVDLGIEGFRSLTDMNMDIARQDIERGRRTAMPMQLNRFWFYPGENSFEEAQGIAEIKSSPVTLLTEAEFLTTRGEMKGSGKVDPLAANFTQSFTSKYDEIAKKKTIYAELEGLFRLVALAKLMKTKDVETEAGFSLQYFMEHYPVSDTHVDRSLPGLGNVKDFSQRNETSRGYREVYLCLPSCGGVAININVDPRRIAKDPTGSLQDKRNKILQARPSVTAGSWNVPGLAPADIGAPVVTASTPITQTASPRNTVKISFRGQNIWGRWIFRDEAGEHKLSGKGLIAYLTGRGGGGNFIITHDKEGPSADWEKREHTTGDFARNLYWAGAESVFIASHPEEAEKKLERPLPTLRRNMDVLYDQRVVGKSSALKSAIEEFQKTGALVSELRSSISDIKDNAMVVVAPFSPDLVNDIRNKARSGLFRDKAVLLVVCGQRSNTANHENFIRAINELNHEGAHVTVSFEHLLPYEDAADFLRELLKLTEEQKVINLMDAIRKLEETTGNNKILRLLKMKRHDAKMATPSDYLAGSVIYSTQRYKTDVV